MSEKLNYDHIHEAENHSESYDITIVKDEWMKDLDADEPFITQQWECAEDLSRVCGPLKVKEEECESSEDADYQCGPVKAKQTSVSVKVTAHWNHETRVRVIALIKDGSCCPSEAGKRCGVPKVTARRWWRTYVTTGHTRRLSGSGRPRVSSEKDDQCLLDNIRTNPFLGCQHLGEISEFPGSVKTVRRRLKDKGVLCQRAAINQRLTLYQRIDRMAFAEEYIAFDWSRVIFSDEKMFSSKSNAPVQVYRLQGERSCPRYLVERERSGHCSITIWGYISAQGAGPLWKIEGILDTDAYVNILENIMKPSVEMLYPQGDVYFLLGHSRFRRSRAVQEWFHGQDRIKLMMLVPRSPDLNPIENMWVEVLRSLPVGSRNASDLWENIEKTWWKINHHKKLSKQLVDSVPRRLGETLRRDGGWVGYYKDPLT